ncbi:MAG: ANTAR domain-containing protein [Thermoleophilaceae bacterium]
MLVLYRDRLGALSADELGLGLVLADVGTQLILGAQAGAPPDALHDVLAAEPAHLAEIHQATGMLSVQLEVSLDEAFVLRAYAFAHDRSLRAVARDVLARRLRLAQS